MRAVRVLCGVLVLTTALAVSGAFGEESAVTAPAATNEGAKAAPDPAWREMGLLVEYLPEKAREALQAKSRDEGGRYHCVLPLAGVCERLGMKLTWDPEQLTATVEDSAAPELPAPQGHAGGCPCERCEATREAAQARARHAVFALASSPLCSAESDSPAFAAFEVEQRLMAYDDTLAKALGLKVSVNCKGTCAVVSDPLVAERKTAYFVLPVRTVACGAEQCVSVKDALRVWEVTPQVSSRGLVPLRLALPVSANYVEGFVEPVGYLGPALQVLGSSEAARDFAGQFNGDLRPYRAAVQRQCEGCLCNGYKCGRLGSRPGSSPADLSPDGSR